MMTGGNDVYAALLRQRRLNPATAGAVGCRCRCDVLNDCVVVVVVVVDVIVVVVVRRSTRSLSTHNGATVTIFIAIILASMSVLTSASRRFDDVLLDEFGHVSHGGRVRALQRCDFVAPLRRFAFIVRK